MSEWDAVVLDLDGGQRLERCVDSLESQTYPPSNVVIVDNGSLVPVSERIGERRIAIDIVRSDENLGFTGGVNLGWRRTSAPFLALINNDVVLSEDWASSLLRQLAAHERAGAVQSLILRTDGRIDGGGIDVGSGRFLQAGHGLQSSAELPDPWGVSATAAIYRRRALEETSIDGALLHPGFFAYYEDVELAARLKRAGWEAKLVRRALARHEGSATSSILGRRAVLLRTRNRYFVTRLHPGVGSRSVLLGEDARRMVRAAKRGEMFEIITIVRGVAAGLFAPIDQR